MKKIFNVFAFMFLFIFLSSCTINNSHVHSYIDGMCDCGEYDLQWLNENFDLSEEKIATIVTINPTNALTPFNPPIKIIASEYITIIKMHF